LDSKDGLDLVTMDLLMMARSTSSMQHLEGEKV